MTWSIVHKDVLAPKGFLFAGISAGLKDSNKKDLGLILAPENSIFTGFFTHSIVRASCVEICQTRLKNTNGLIRAILINSGHANACTGDNELRDSLIATKEISNLLGVSEEEVLLCSTGVIGIPIPMKKLLKNLPELVSKLNTNNFKDLSEAILTTDLVAKRIIIEKNINGRQVRIAGFAKGSGMIYPNMATMLAFLTCDAGIEKGVWDQMIADALEISFNAISVDGETSTNDSFIALNTGEKIDSQYLPLIKEGINHVCQYLAKSIARDGEGANCLLEVVVSGASNDLDATKLAKFVCNSSLVKTAVHGCDPNWGRIISAAGNSGVLFDFSKVDLMIGNFEILQAGKLKNYNKQKVSDYLKSKMNSNYLVDDIVQINLNLNSGNGEGKAWGCDLSKEYVVINSEYTT